MQAHAFMPNHQVIVGAGIGGLGAAIALGLKGQQTTLYERSATHSEFGAGIQLGPNALKRLKAWGLMSEVMRFAATPRAIEVYDWSQSKPLARMALGESFKARYGLPYLSVHRGDLHAMLLARVHSVGQTDVHMNSQLHSLEQSTLGVQLQFKNSSNGEFLPDAQAQSLLACDGVFSTVRQTIWPNRVLNNTGHIAYRALVPQHMLPLNLRSENVQVWMGPGAHWVQYPVRGGEWLNVVVLMQASERNRERPLTHAEWQATREPQQIQADFARALFRANPILQEMTRAIGTWGSWQLWDTEPLQGPHQMVQDRVALLGDAAHPMLPYLAQAGAMAIEDAQSLAECMSQEGQSVQFGLSQYAKIRWLRNSRVQARARLQSKIYHAQGALGWARNFALKSLGESIMHLSWVHDG
jgi:salicylate hydroxylase